MSWGGIPAKKLCPRHHARPPKRAMPRAHRRGSTGVNVPSLRFDRGGGVEAQVLAVEAGDDLHALRKAARDPRRDSDGRHADEARGRAEPHRRPDALLLLAAAHVEADRYDRLGKHRPEDERVAGEEERPVALESLAHCRQPHVLSEFDGAHEAIESSL